MANELVVPPLCQLRSRTALPAPPPSLLWPSPASASNALAHPSPPPRLLVPRQVAAEIEELHQPKAGDHALAYGELNVTTPTYQFRVLLQRNLIMYWRYPGGCAQGLVPGPGGGAEGGG